MLLVCCRFLPTASGTIFVIHSHIMFPTLRAISLGTTAKVSKPRQVTGFVNLAYDFLYRLTHFTGSRSPDSYYYQDYEVFSSGSGLEASCKDSDVAIWDCKIPSFRQGRCSAFSVIRCLIAPEAGTEGEVRLANSNTDGNIVFGELEIYHDGAWGRVCSFGKQVAAQVACRHLGYYDKGEFCT